MQKEFGIKTLQEAVDHSWDNPNLYWKVFQKAAELYLKQKGYQGAFWTDEDEVSPKQYQIWDKKVVKKK